jgi:hypothetical protein
LKSWLIVNEPSQIAPGAQALVRIHPVIIWFAHCFVPSPGYGLVCPVLSSRARSCRRDHQAPSAPLPDVGVTFVRETCSASCGDITLRSSLVRAHVPIPYGSPLLRFFTSFEESLQVATSPCCPWDLPDVMLRIFLQMPEPLPRRSAECPCLVLPQRHRPSPEINGSASSRFFPANTIFRRFVSRLQLFHHVQASEFARLPDRSHRCEYPHRAAEAFTSEQNVRRYLRTHRICYPPDYRQLAERGLSPRQVLSLVGCSLSL